MSRLEPPGPTSISNYLIYFVVGILYRRLITFGLYLFKKEPELSIKNFMSLLTIFFQRK